MGRTYRNTCVTSHTAITASLQSPYIVMETSIKCVKYTLFLFNLLFTVSVSNLLLAFNDVSRFSSQDCS